MRRLGIDPGARRVGLALCDEDGRLAYPHGTLTGAAVDALAAEIARVAKEHEVGEVVVGLPLHLSGREGSAARKARALAGALEARLLDVRVVLWDERLTTVSAERQLRAAGRSAKQQRDVIDQAAATVLLQSYLDAQRDH